MHRLVLVPGTNTMPFSPWKRVAEEMNEVNPVDVSILRMYLT